MTGSRTCACGAALPKDKRVKRCVACAGAALRAADNARHARAAKRFRDKIWWRYFGCALRAKISLYCIAEVPTGKVWEDPHVLRRVSRAAHVQLGQLETALTCDPVTRQVFERLCRWIGWPPSTFEHRRRDPRNLRKSNPRKRKAA